MKQQDIKEIERGEHCFGPILTVNGVEYDDLKREDVVSLVMDVIDNDLNSHLFLRECFEKALDYLELDVAESDSDYCDQCGNYNHYSREVS